VERDLGYRLLCVDEDVQAAFGLANGSPGVWHFDAASRRRSHGARLAFRGDINSGRPFAGMVAHLDFGLGLTTFVAGTESRHDTDGSGQQGAFDMAIDAMLQVRLEFGRGFYFRLGYVGDRGGFEHGATQSAWGSDGVTFGMGVRIGH
jgi:hypothetical protein